MVLPTDFTGDGITDLVAQLNSGIWFWRGIGDGTFAARVETAHAGTPLTRGDFNGDRRFDLVIQDGNGVLHILPGRGDGSFGAPLRVDSFAQFLIFALAFDFTGDSRRDLAVGDTRNVHVYPGNGDGTFGPRMTLPAALNGPSGAVAEDFNRDGRRDLAVAQNRESLTVYLNRGSVLFNISHEAHLAPEEKRV